MPRTDIFLLNLIEKINDAKRRFIINEIIKKMDD